jgi:two-component sensor histidine kinase
VIKKIIDIIFHPAFLGFIIFIIIILLLPPVFNKYQVKIKEVKIIPESEVFSYYDLNSDGFSEEVWYQRPFYGYPTFIIRNKGKIIDQWNLKGDFTGGDFFIYCDYNNDSITEIFVLTINNDSIFLTGINPYEIEESYFLKLFIDKSNLYEGRYDCHVSFCDLPDTDENGYLELVFAISTGMSKQPRNLYLVDIFNDTVIKSPESGTAIYLPVAFDINNDGYNEYMGKSCAFGNFYRILIDYPDTNTWIMVLDRNMNFLFEPKKFGQYKTILFTKPFRPFNTNYIAALQIHQGTENIDNKLMLFDANGNLIRERIIEDFAGIENSFLLSRDKVRCNDLYMYVGNGQFEQIDSNLNTISTVFLPDIQNARPSCIDIDLDGKDEFIFMKKDRHGLIITRNDFSSPVKLEFNNEIYDASYFSLVKQGDETPDLCFKLGERSFIMEYYKNPLYPIIFFIWFGIYLGIFILLFLLQKIQHFRAKKKLETEQKIAELQLKSIKGQIDPHFTLNLIDSIGNLFYKRDSEKAAYVFGKYAKLLRTTILSAEKISVSLENEIEYVKNYLDLEKFRYDGKFNYNIEIDKKVDTQAEIPKMLIHTFVENAIKHGLKHKEGWGKLDISIEKHNKLIEVGIRDNGIGRQKAKEYSKLSTGKGLLILNNILDLYFELRKTKITYQITDLNTNKGKPDGTLVVINIPEKMKLEIHTDKFRN